MPSPRSVGELENVKELVVPVHAEEAVVGVAVTETGRVRVHKRVVVEPVQLDAVEAFETVLVERVPIERVVEGPQPIRTEGEVTIVPVVDEVVVMEKRFVLREEVRLTRRRTEHTRSVQTEVRREVVTAERVGPLGRAPGGGS